MSVMMHFEFFRNNEPLGKVCFSPDALHVEEEMSEEERRICILEASVSAFHRSMLPLQLGDTVRLNGEYVTTITEELLKTAEDSTVEISDDDDNNDSDEKDVRGFLNALRIRLNKADRDEKAKILKMLPMVIREHMFENSKVHFSDDVDLETQKAEYEAWKKDILDAPEVEEDQIKGNLDKIFEL